MQHPLIGEVNKLVSSYYGDTIELLDGLDFSQYQTLRTIEFYSNDRYLGGNRDELGREKPFYNINKFRVNVAIRATDLDVKDIKIEADDPKDAVKSMILQKEVYNWMKDKNFSKTLNEMGSTRPKYGGLLVKKVEDEELDIQVCQWKNLITDPIDIEKGVIIEKHYLLPSELSAKKEIWDNVEEALKLATKKRKSKNATSEGTDNRIPVFEIHGEFPESVLEEEGEKTDYCRIYAVIAGEEGKQVVLFLEEEKESPYKYLPWKKISGRALGEGVVEEGFEAQVWTNDIKIAEKNVMDLAGKVLLKTNSKKVGNNVLTDLDNGSIVYLEDNKDLTPINLAPSALGVFQQMAEAWDTQYERVSSTFNAITGEQMPSGTPYRQTAILNQEASSLFDYRREEFGIFLSEIFNDWVIPHLIKKINKKHILAADFDTDELKEIDQSFALERANEKLKAKVLEGSIVSQEEYESYQQAFLELVGKTKAVRYLEVPKDYFKDIKAKVTVITTGEQRNKSATLETLNTILVTVAQNPQILQDPVLSKIFARIVEIAGGGISPVSLGINAQQALASQIQNNGLTQGLLPTSTPAGGGVGLPTDTPQGAGSQAGLQ